MKVQPGLRPQDVVVLLKLCLKKDTTWRYMDLASELGISPSEVHASLKRSHLSGLFSQDKRKVFRHALLEFLSFGLRYVFPATVSGLQRGIPTAHSAPPLASRIRGDEDRYVWPHPDGSQRGQAVMPLYPSAPDAALRDPRLHELLALVDAIRLGKAREQKLARGELRSRLQEKTSNEKHPHP